MSWTKFIEQQSKEAYFISLMQFIDKAYKNHIVYPPKNEIYSAFTLCPFSETKVVILGQDPYHGANQAHGLSFSVNHSVSIPPSLRNIFKEINQDVGSEIPEHGNLKRWTNQGVLLLNDTLTVEATKAGSHQKKGWEQFTLAAIQKLSEEKEALVFMLWGAHAQKKMKFIDSNKHLILTASHPSPLSANRGGWFENKHFSKANNFLKSKNIQPICW